MVSTTSETSIQIGVDTGGTFTDIVCITSCGEIYVNKITSTPDNPSCAVIEGIVNAMGALDIRADRIERFVHGTTIATNAIIQKQGGRLGILTTAGFEDVLEIGRQMRTDMYNLFIKCEAPNYLAPRAFRSGVTERIDSNGVVLTPLDEDGVHMALDDLLSKEIESLAICLLFAHRNPTHEQRIREIAYDRAPHLAISISSDVDPQSREYERTVVTAFDAYLKPTVDAYLTDLENELHKLGLNIALHVMQSRGGITTIRNARTKPISLALSGPAGGVIGAQMVGQRNGINNLITMDVGGTSCDIALISDGKPKFSLEGQVGGYPVRVPMIDVNAIGSGGGSIAWLDDSGGLRVGPHSAGAVPGPACYNRGGDLPTLSDASLILGYLNPDRFRKVHIHIDYDKAARVIEDHIAKPLGLSIEAAAAGIHRVINIQMVEGIRYMSVGRGVDPRDFTLVPMGGAGGLHGCAMCDELDMNTILLPKHPGVMAAEGLLRASVEQESVAAVNVLIEDTSLEELQKIYHALYQKGYEIIKTESADEEQLECKLFADACVDGQSFTLTIPFELDGANSLVKFQEHFLDEHESVNGHNPDASVRLVNLRLIQSHGTKNTFSVDQLQSDLQISQAVPIEHRSIIGISGHKLEASIYSRDHLKSGNTMIGPAIIEQDDATTLIKSNWKASVLISGDIRINRLSVC